MNALRDTNTLTFDFPDTPLTQATRSPETFEVLGRLGIGGMGVVLEARQGSVDRNVALKCLRNGVNIESRSDQLVREAWVMGQLDHPNIVPIYSLATHDDGPAIVCKKIVGKEWSAYLRNPQQLREQLGISDTIEWHLGVLLKVIDAVRFAHSKGIVHRDLKPSNVMIGEFGEVYVMDWGLAVSLRPEHVGKIQLASDVFQTSGTYCYLAPEMLEPQRLGITEKTDVYQLGGILYEICMGHPPHWCDSHEKVEVSIRRSRPIFCDGLPHELVLICQQAMRVDAWQRYKSADALRIALIDYLGHRGATQLRISAERLLADLLRLLRSAESPNRNDVNAIVGPCHFAFQQALAQWPDDLQAQRGLIECAHVTAEYELASGRPGQALACLGEGASTDLRMRCEVAVQEELDREQERQVLLRRSSREVDAGSRRLAISSIAVGWALGPIALAVFQSATTYSIQAATQLGFLSLWLLVALWGERWVYSTELNMRSYSMVLGATLLALVVKIGSYLMGVSPATAQVYDLFVFFSAGLLTTLLIDWRMWPSAIGYLIAFVVSAKEPTLCLWAMAASNAVLAVTVTLVWRDTSSAGR